MGNWTLQDINWKAFDPSKIDVDMLKVVKAAALVEYNATDYQTYLKNVFREDIDFQKAVKAWTQEEVQHGIALAKWAQLADPSFSFEDALKRFREGYRIPVEATSSVRGSLWGELVSRCIIETGTSSFYTALKDATQEPVLKEICAHIAADEFRHYKLFYTYLQPYLAKEHPSKWARFLVALKRLGEAEDDELAMAFYAANFEELNKRKSQKYSREENAQAYLSRVYSYYSKEGVNRAVSMILKAVGLSPQGIFSKVLFQGVWLILLQKRKK